MSDTPHTALGSWSGYIYQGMCAAYGQFVSIAIAFLLSLNKLYDKNNFLAIDDPVQTIDDIDFGGLIETIRHEFYGYNLFVSTHEDNYASLLRYKLENLGVRTKAYDMKKINYRQHQQ